MGGSPSVQAPKAPDTALEYQQALQAYVGNAPALYKEESQYQPLYNQMQTGMNLQNNAAFAQQYFGVMAPVATATGIQEQQQVSGAQANLMAQYGPQATANMYASNPAFGQLQQQATSQLGATADPTLTGMRNQVQGAIPGQVQGFQDLSAQVGRDVTPVNEQLQSLYGKVGADTTAADLTNIRNRVAADPRGDIFKQTQAQVMGQLGQVDPLTGQLKDLASQQLALGGKISEQESQDVTQQARAAFSARGMLNSNASIGSELLNRDQYQQQRLAQREQFGMGVSQLADTQSQERTANAMGLTSTDIAATQANMQLAGQMTQGIAGINQANVGLQSGLQGQIASNLAQARQQQTALQQNAVSAFQTGTQQAAGLQGSILDEIYRQQAAGTAGLQYLTGTSQANLASIMGAQNAGANMSAIPAQMNAYGGGGPSLFQSSGILSLMNQNQMAQMNATGGANIASAQAKSAQQAGMMQAGGAVAGAAIGIAGTAILL